MTMNQDGLKVFEVTAAGFDASSDAADDLVYWVAAPSGDSVKAAIQDTGAVFCGNVMGWSMDDVDYTLPAEAVQLSSALLEKASEHRNRNRLTT